MRAPRLDVVIPCLNEVGTIKRAILDAKKFGEKYSLQTRIIVADNGSTDGSVDTIKRIPKVKVVHVPVRGYGAALHWGILNSDAEYVMFGDADLSYPFSNIQRMSPLLVNNPDLVLGSRLRGTIQPGAMPFLHRYLGTPVLTMLINWFYGINSSDCNSGMRIVKRSFYKTLNMRNSGMEWASELLLKTALKKGKYMEVPIRFLKDKRNRPPHLSTWSDGWRHLKAIFLLKPTSLFYIMFGCLILAVLAFSVSFSASYFLILLSATIAFSYLALKFLEFAIERKHNNFSIILNSNRLVIWIVMVTIIVAGLTFLVGDDRLGTKLLLVSFNAIAWMWAFLIETIKTHMVNRLPEVER